MPPSKPKSDPFSVRLCQDLNDEIFHVIKATGGEVTRSQIVDMALRSFLLQLRQFPSMIEGYDIEEDVSVTQKNEL